MLSHSRITFLVGVVAIAGLPANAAAPTTNVPATHAAFFKANCLRCHSADKAEGNVRLDNLPYEIATVEVAEKWQKVLGVLNSGEMPPADEPRPDDTGGAEFDTIGSSLFMSSDQFEQYLAVCRKAVADALTRW